MNCGELCATSRDASRVSSSTKRIEGERLDSERRGVSGRTGRPLLNWQLLQAGFLLTVIQVEERTRYPGALDCDPKSGHAGHLVDPTLKLTSLDLMDRKRFGDAATAATVLFAYCGLVGAFVQGGPLGKLVKRMGEPRLIAASLFLVAASLAPLPFIHGDTKLSWSVLLQPAGVPWWELFAVLALLAIGSGLTRPPLFGMLSILTPAHEQGETIGVAQSAGSLARIFGPLFAGGLFHVHPTWPYVACAALALGTGTFAWVRLVKSEPALLAAKTQSGATM